MDLRDLENNTADGLHVASLAGAWTALVTGFGGMRAVDGAMRFAPRLPEGITALRFKLRYRARRISVDITASRVVYRLLDGDPLGIGHHGEMIELGPDPVERPIPSVSRRPTPKQPAGRQPAPHHIGVGGAPEPGWPKGDGPVP
jgi:alpha,alpha-trehalose phosphorylase